MCCFFLVKTIVYTHYIHSLGRNCCLVEYKVAEDLGVVVVDDGFSQFLFKFSLDVVVSCWQQAVNNNCIHMREREIYQ